MNSAIPDDHVGFHLECDGKKGLFYGIFNPETGRTSCRDIISKGKISRFLLKEDDLLTPFVHYEILGKTGNVPAYDFARVLSSAGIPLDKNMTRALTNFIGAGTHIYHASPGYELERDNEKITAFKSRIMKYAEGEDDRQKLNAELDAEIKSSELKFSKFKLITPDRTPESFEKEFIFRDLDEISETLRDLYEITNDKRAFVIAFAYSLLAPFAYLVRRERLFFPNLIFMGLPETGKNSLLNLFLGTMWLNEDKILTSGDFMTEFATMANLEGTGLPLVINDLEQPSFDRMRKYFMEGAMNPRSGSRGRANLEVQEFQSLRGIAISSNYLSIGPPEATSRFIIHLMRDAEPSKSEEWNRLAAKLRGGMYPIADAFVKWLNHFADPEIFLGYFRQSRREVKRTIIDLGKMVLENIVQIDVEDFQYEEYLEDHLSIFVSWVQYSFRKMEKEQNYYEKDYYDHNVVTVRYDDSFYIRRSATRENSEEFIVFPLAWKDFLKKYPDFPYKSMDAFAKVYPEFLKSQPRKFGGRDGKQYRVLIISGLQTLFQEEQKAEVVE